MEKDRQEIPEPTDINVLDVPDGAIKSLVSVDMAQVRKAWNTRSASRTVTLPAWLDEKAKREQVNFSQVLQQALKDALGIKQGDAAQTA